MIPRQSLIVSHGKRVRHTVQFASLVSGRHVENSSTKRSNIYSSIPREKGRDRIACRGRVETECGTRYRAAQLRLDEICRDPAPC